jgi:imidazolonepropionase-like amidohydrolase
MPEHALVVQGGTLIDGTGRPPIENSVVVIESGRFKAVGTRDTAAIPPDARVIDARGKTVLPGFIDGHGHWEDFHGELHLHLGITTCASIEAFQDGAWTLAQKQGTDLGKIRGPRLWISGRAIGTGAATLEEGYGGSRATRGHITVTTAEEARQAVRRKKELGCDIIKMNEFISYDLAKALVDEAHRLGMPVTAHSWDVIESVKAGVDSIEHIWSVGYTSILDVKRRRDLARQRLAGNIEQEIAGSFYQPENYDDIIEAMVKRGVAWTPTIAKWLRPLSSYAPRFRERESQILDDPNANLPVAVRAITEAAYDKFYKRYTPEQLSRAKLFHENAKEFIARFVRAGGLLKEGSDPPTGMAGLLLHEGLAMDVEAGVPPMMAIQAATLNVAKTFKKERDYGSVEAGKIADLAIIEGDPLKDIWMTQNVKMVIMDGKQIDIGFHKYKNPIPSIYNYQSLPRDLEISPLRITAGSGPAVLRVRGRGMWPFHRVMLNGQPLPTEFISKSELHATIEPTKVAEAGTYIVTVKDENDSIPESNRAHLIVGFGP